DSERNRVSRVPTVLVVAVTPGSLVAGFTLGLRVARRSDADLRGTGNEHPGRPSADRDGSAAPVRSTPMEVGALRGEADHPGQPRIPWVGSLRGLAPLCRRPIHPGGWRVST